MNVLRNIKWLVTTECMYSVTSVFINTFIIAYIFELSGKSAVETGLYYLFRSVAVFIVAFISGYYLKKHCKMSMYRLAPLLNLVLFALIYFLGDDVKNYTGYLGFISGNIVILRWMPRNLLISDLVSKEYMIKYQGYVSAIVGFTNIAIPFLLGLFLTFDSYNDVMMILSILLLIELLSTFMVKENRANLSAQYEPVKYLKILFKSKEPLFVCFMEFFRGLTLVGILPVLMKLYIVYLFVTPLKLGSLTSIFAFTTIIANFVFGKFCKYKYFSFILMFSTIVTILASLMFVLYPSSVSFLCYNFCFVSVAQILLTITLVNIFNVSNIKKIKETYKTEYFAIREMFLNGGRIIGAGLLVLISSYQDFEVLRYFILALTLSMIIMGWCAIKINAYLETKTQN